MRDVEGQDSLLARKLAEACDVEVAADDASWSVGVVRLVLDDE